MELYKDTDFGRIPKRWNLKRIIDIKAQEKRAIAMGPFGSNIKAENFVDKGVPVIRGTNLNYDRYVDGDFVYLTEQKADELLGSNCMPGDIVFTHRGTIGQVGLIPKDKYPRYVISQSGMKLSVDANIVDSLFLFYFFKSSFGQFQLLKYESQVGVPSISNPLTSLKEIEVPVPPLSEQKAIAEVLSSLDDKIDLLHRQNKTLEAMAETLFRQWFVEEQSDLKPLSKCIKTTSGGTPSRKIMDYYQNGTHLWVKSKELNGGYILNTEEKITEDAIYSSSAKLLPENTILIAMYGATVGQYAILAQKAACNQAICACIPNSTYPYTFLYHSVKANVEELKSRAVGSAQQNISQVLIKSLEIAVNENIGRFHKAVHPMMEKIKLNYVQIKTLEKLRDSLLPKLMSGEVRVK